MQEIFTLLEKLKLEKNFRELTPLKHKNLFLQKNEKWLYNLASNDYLNVAWNEDLKKEFLDSKLFFENAYFGATSSRSLSGNFSIYSLFEEHLKEIYKKESLLFNSGYHANIGVISALAELKETLFIADKFVHASHIDGLKSFKKVNLKRFLHNDLENLESLLQENHKNYTNIIILTESLYSMQGDFLPLGKLVAIKNKYKNVYLYVDEAHSIGSFGEKGFGLCYEKELLKSIDFLILTFGKALGSVGACVLCDRIYKEYFINKARSLIYSTALPPINVAFSYFVFQKLEYFKDKREALFLLSKDFKNVLLSLGDFEVLGDYNILSLVLKENAKAIFFQKSLENKGFFCPAIKSPTIPKNRACLRFSLTSGMDKERLENLKIALMDTKNEYAL